MAKGWRFLLKVLSILLALLFLYHLWILGHVLYWRYHNPASTAFIKAHQKASPTTLIQQRWVPYHRISKHLKQAVIAAEDSRFMTHHGFDWEGIQEAIQKNIRHQKIVAGGSTISQQLAKNLFLSDQKSIRRKLEEAIITVMLEKIMGKRRILEIYLNTIEWGQGIFGAEMASLHYFGLSAKDLSFEQAAKLAAMISNPRFYDKIRYTRKLNRKTHTVIRHMKGTQTPATHKK